MKEVDFLRKRDLEGACVFLRLSGGGRGLGGSAWGFGVWDDPLERRRRRFPLPPTVRRSSCHFFSPKRPHHTPAARCCAGNIKFTDLNDPTYKPEENGGVGFEEGMKVRVCLCRASGGVDAGAGVFGRRSIDRLPPLTPNPSPTQNNLHFTSGDSRRAPRRVDRQGRGGVPPRLRRHWPRLGLRGCATSRFGRGYGGTCEIFNQPTIHHPTKPNPVTKIPFVGSVADAAYDLWAVNRLKLTGRPELEEILKERQAKIEATNYDDCEDECEIKW